MRNIELKARLRDPQGALQTCHALGAVHQGDIHQIDTYFRVPEGRLKLRESEPGGDYLVFYRREDESGPRASNYFIEPVSRSVKRILAAALDVVAVVEKTRSLFLWENVRIHLDSVTGLGAFIEFEAVLSERHDDVDGHRKLAHLKEAFAITPADLLAQSYADLIVEAGSATPEV